MKRTRTSDTSSIRAGKEKVLSTATLTNAQARLLVSNYYQAQELRKRGDMQLRHLGDKVDPHGMLTYFADCQAYIEKDIQAGLEKFAQASAPGRWMLAQDGIGPVISSGLLAHIDIRKAPTVGHIWSFAGYDARANWVGRIEADKLIHDVLKEQGRKKTDDTTVAMACGRTNKKFANVLRFATRDIDGKAIPLTNASLAKAISWRPWNPDLKQICWHMGECFKRISNNPDSVYGRLYRIRKGEVVARNERGHNAERAKTYVTKSDDVRKKLALGKLPDGNLDSQAMWYAIKIFLSHAHAVMFWDHFKTSPPKPFAIDILRHTDEIIIPRLDMLPGLSEAYYGRNFDVAAE